jgi:hypothetical protein
MENDTPTLAVLLCMHRSGSSYTASVLQALGMSLGPFPLVGAASSNIHGHYESVPFLTLGRKVQEVALGFDNDFPNSVQALADFHSRKGIWREGVTIPDELIDEGRRLIAGLIGTGKISGFKDPRTVLIWPFWRRVLAAFPGLRVVLVPLLRSPHEIAMSLSTRLDGQWGYWSSLDLVAAHFDRMKTILESGRDVARAIRFGSESYFDDVAEAARLCGLTWNLEDAQRVLDRTCVHHEPATVYHEAQTLYEELGGHRPPEGQAERNGWLLARDARKCEQLSYRLLSQPVESLRISDAQLAHTHQAGLQNEEALRDIRNQLDQAQQAYSQIQNELSDAHNQLDQARGEMSRALESEQGIWQECQRLREQRDRFESHPVLGQVLRARRRVKDLMSRSASGSSARRIQQELGPWS